MAHLGSLVLRVYVSSKVFTDCQSIMLCETIEKLHNLRPSSVALQRNTLRICGSGELQAFRPEDIIQKGLASPLLSCWPTYVSIRSCTPNRPTNSRRHG